VKVESGEIQETLRNRETAQGRGKCAISKESSNQNVHTTGITGLGHRKTPGKKTEAPARGRGERKHALEEGQ